MSDINWDLAPEGAVAIKQDADNHLYWVDNKNVYWDGDGWANCSHSLSWLTIATCTQQGNIKVGDTVKRIAGSHCGMRVGDTATVTHFGCDGITLKEYGSTHDEENFEVVTQQKTVAGQEAKREEKWTHAIKATKEKCRITEGPNNSGQVFIKTEAGLWDCLYIEQLKPIKPKMTLKQYDACACMAYHFNITSDEFSEYLSGFDITD